MEGHTIDPGNSFYAGTDDGQAGVIGQTGKAMDGANFQWVINFEVVRPNEDRVPTYEAGGH